MLFFLILELFIAGKSQSVLLQFIIVLQGPTHCRFCCTRHMMASVIGRHELKCKGTLNTRWFLWLINSPTALNVPQDLKTSGWQRANKQPVLQHCEEWTAMTGLTEEDVKTRRHRSTAGARMHFKQWCRGQQTYQNQMFCVSLWSSAPWQSSFRTSSVHGGKNICISYDRHQKDAHLGL